jgi:hypothetical protein
VDENGAVRFVKMRSGLKSLSPNKEDRSFMELNPLLIMGACGKLSSWAGDVESVSIRYEKVVMHLMRHRGRVLALTIERETAPEDDNRTISEISRSLAALMA